MTTAAPRPQGSTPSSYVVFTDGSHRPRKEGKDVSASAYLAFERRGSSMRLVEVWAEFLGDREEQTSSMAEEHAILTAISRYREAGEVQVFSDFFCDSAYARRTGAFSPELLSYVDEDPQVHLHHVAAHKGHVLNEIADGLASSVAKHPQDLPQLLQRAREEVEAGHLPAKGSSRRPSLTLADPLLLQGLRRMDAAAALTSLML